MSYSGALQVLKRYRGKGLAAIAYRRGNGVCCAIGAVVPSTRKVRSSLRIRVLADVSEVISGEMKALGLTREEAAALQRTNDCFFGTDEARKQHVIAWLEARVAEEASK